jgi:hypothetical protein
MLDSHSAQLGVLASGSYTPDSAGVSRITISHDASGTKPRYGPGYGPTHANSVDHVGTLDARYHLLALAVHVLSVNQSALELIRPRARSPVILSQ